MARMCGIQKIALREDDPGSKIRLAAEDIQGEVVQGKPVEPGLYFCGKDAWDKYAPRVLERLQKTPAIDHSGKPVLNPDGSPKMFAEPDATLASIPPALLC